MEYTNKIHAFVLILLVLVFKSGIYSQPMTITYPDFNLAIDYFVANKQGHKVTLFKSYCKQVDIPTKKNEKDTTFFYVTVAEDALYWNDSLKLGFRTGIDYSIALELKHNILKYDPDCIDILYSSDESDTILIQKFRVIPNVKVYFAKKIRGMKFKIISQIGVTNDCGVIRFTIPFSRDYVVVFQKEGYIHEIAILCREIDKPIWMPKGQ